MHTRLNTEISNAERRLLMLATLDEYHRVYLAIVRRRLLATCNHAAHYGLRITVKFVEFHPDTACQWIAIVWNNDGTENERFHFQLEVDFALFVSVTIAMKGNTHAS